MIRVFHVNLRTLWIYRRIRKLARLATSNVSELPFSSTVAFFFSLSLNKSFNIIAHNLTFKFNPGRKERKRLRFVSQFLTHYLSLVTDRWHILSEFISQTIHILWTIKFQIATNSSIPLLIPSFSSLRTIRPLNVHQSRNCIEQFQADDRSRVRPADWTTVPRCRVHDVSTRCHRSTPVDQAKGQQLSCNYRFPNCCARRDATVMLHRN